MTYQSARELAQAFRREGWTFARIGLLLGVSKQRAHQLCGEERAKPRKRGRPKRLFVPMLVKRRRRPKFGPAAEELDEKLEAQETERRRQARAQLIAQERRRLAGVFASQLIRERSR